MCHFFPTNKRSCLEYYQTPLVLISYRMQVMSVVNTGYLVHSIPRVRNFFCMCLFGILEDGDWPSCQDCPCFTLSHPCFIPSTLLQVFDSCKPLFVWYLLFHVQTKILIKAFSPFPSLIPQNREQSLIFVWQKHLAQYLLFFIFVLQSESILHIQKMQLPFGPLFMLL